MCNVHCACSCDNRNLWLGVSASIVTITERPVCVCVTGYQPVSIHLFVNVPLKSGESVQETCKNRCTLMFDNVMYHNFRSHLYNCPWMFCVFFFHFEKLFQFINDSNGFELIWNTLFDILSIQLLSISNTSLFFRSNCDKVINKMEQFQWCNWKFAYKKREFRRNKEFSKK